MRKEEAERMRELLVEAITTLCRSGMNYKSGMKVEGLLGVTLDDEDIILVNINKTYEIPKPAKEKVQMDSETVVDRSSENKKKRCSPMTQNVQYATESVVDSEETVSVKREYSGEFQPNKRRKSTDFNPHPSDSPVVPSGAGPSRVPSFHDAQSIEALNSQDIPQIHHVSDSGTFNVSLSDNNYLSPDKVLNTDSTSEGNTKESGVKIEISSGSEDNDTNDEAGSHEQSQFAGQEGALYGVPVDMQGVPLPGYNPAVPGLSVGGSGDYSYSDTSFQDSSGNSGSVKVSSGVGEDSMKFGTRYQCCVFKNLNILPCFCSWIYKYSKLFFPNLKQAL